jgi:hypothetical protein
MSIKAGVLRFVVLTALLLLLLSGCGSEPAAPPLAEPGQPTLVYVFTDG